MWFFWIFQELVPIFELFLKLYLLKSIPQRSKKLTFISENCPPTPPIQSQPLHWSCINFPTFPSFVSISQLLLLPCVLISIKGSLWSQTHSKGADNNKIYFLFHSENYFLVEEIWWGELSDPLINPIRFFPSSFPHFSRVTDPSVFFAIELVAFCSER